MKHKVILFIGFIFLQYSVEAQYAPPAGQEGSTAMHKDSSAFVAWATACSVERGYLDLTQPDSGFVSAGNQSMALGKADNQIVSLGDGGVATLQFDHPIENGPGNDFAVFENSFLDNFLELAFVEVSSDGINFYRFPAVSLTQTNEQIGPFGFIDATHIYNFAGKYRVDYGTPFDLEELANIPELNTDSILALRIVDVGGTIDPDYASFDSEGHPVNDPWPTPFPSGGFDLDAVGVIHQLWQHVNKYYPNVQVRVFPNPCLNRIYINASSAGNISELTLIDLEGRIFCQKSPEKHSATLNMDQLPAGMYTLRFVFNGRTGYRKIIKK